MPFTFAHPAAAVIFKPYLQRGKLSITGFVIGTMAPDFEYFLRMKMSGEFGHSFAGIFLFDLPIAILVAFIFHCRIRNTLIENLPHALAARFWIYRQQSWPRTFRQHYLIIIFSILIGTLTHILWDSFTHQKGFAVQQISMLQYAVDILQYQIPVYKFLQHSSSVFGLLLMMWIIYRLKPMHIESVQFSLQLKFKYWYSVIMTFMLFIGLWVVFNSDLIFKIGHVVVAFIACGFWSVCVVSLFKKMRISTDQV